MKETQTPFIMNYLMNIWTPSKIIQQKDRFSIGKLGVIILFLLALLLTPFALNRTTDDVTLTDYLPHSRSLFNQTTLSKIHQLTINGGEKEGSVFTVKTKTGRVMSVNGDIPSKQIRGNALVFGKNECLISDENGKQMMIHYPRQKQSFSNDRAKCYQQLNQWWISQNRLTFNLLFLWTSFTIVLSLFVLVTLGGIVGLYFVLRRIKCQHRIKVSLTLVLLSAGFPTMISSIAGIVSHDPMLTLQLQMALWVLMIALVFCKLLAPTLNIGRELKQTFWKGNAK